MTNSNVTIARWILRGAGIYGLLTIVPMFFLESRLGEVFPPPLNHPECYYGFAAVTLAWQVAFLVMAGDPVRYRPLLPAAFLEKACYAAAISILVVQQRVAAALVLPAAVDLILGALFLVAFGKTRQPRPGIPARA